MVKSLEKHHQEAKKIDSEKSRRMKFSLLNFEEIKNFSQPII